jgi:hypothetical protein
MSELAASLAVPLLACSALVAVDRVGRRAGLCGPESLALAFAAALTWCMAGGLVLGVLGVLRGPAVAVWIAGGVAASLAFGLRGGSLRQFLADVKESWRGWSWVLLLVAPLGLLLLLATVPPWYRDSLVYHLALPRHFAQHGALAWPDDNIFAAFPLGWEAALALLHALGAAPEHDPLFNPRLVGAWTFGAAGLAAVALARAAGASRAMAATAGALLLALPTAIEFGSSAYVEGALLLFVGLALWATLRAGSGAWGERGWLASAVFAGLACWLKYPALIAVLFLAVAAPLLETLRRDEPGAAAWLRRVVRWSSLATLVGCPFFVRNLVWRGNPVFPSAYGLFGGTGWDEWRAWAYGVTLDHYGAGRSALDYVALPWRLFTQRDFHGGFEGSLGPVVGMGAVVGAIAWWRARRDGFADADAAARQLALLLVWVAAVSVFWAVTVQQARFYLIATPALLALLAAGGSRLLAGARPRASVLAVALLLGAQGLWSAGPVMTLWARQATGDWLAGNLDRGALLERMLPETFVVTREIERWVPEDGRVWLVWMRGYTYYLNRPYRLDCVFEAWRFEALLDASDAPRAVGAALRKDGITHVLVNHRFFLQGGNADLQPGRTDRLRERFAAALAQGQLTVRKRWGPIALYEVADQASPNQASPDQASPRLARMRSSGGSVLGRKGWPVICSKASM